jgi:hypothetical protein
LLLVYPYDSLSAPLFIFGRPETTTKRWAESTRAAVGMVTQACPYCYCSRFRIKEKHACTTSLCIYICRHACAGRLEDVGISTSFSRRIADTVRVYSIPYSEISRHTSSNTYTVYCTPPRMHGAGHDRLLRTSNYICMARYYKATERSVDCS